ncbi:hypothetical protein NEF87_004732 [Candidatus Lokiarchaeum ossiferum]|uniref:Acyltransferase 3 domain-containing protein n=1 Tax=Candidatus Lokiarchaeum ossiferum TaxID=2951803 RepID=A0ABY6HZZ7_9ARCH|nr:hypothetical protein NEF87_004732 [Candidatus Lokiarchaeum sp. B-35]
MGFKVTTPQNQINYGIDLLKGLLILGVIGIHAVNGDWRINLNSYILHSFVVPVFLGLSGYLVNHHFIENSTLSQVFKKYFKRMLKPWLIACLCYYTFDLIYGWTTFSISSLFRIIFLPSYHLWYVYAMFLYILCIWGLKKIHLKNSVIFIISLFISLIWILFFDFSYDWSNETLNLIFLKYKLHYFTFFIFGYSLNELEPQKDEILKKVVGWGAFTLSFYRITDYLQITQTNYITTLDFYILNFALILFLIPKFESIKFFDIEILEQQDSKVVLKRKWNKKGKIFWPIITIGKYSLEIYLWHVMFQYIIYFFV